ncbi:RING-type domain-containing protein [Mycena chlorophos]|uniref:RING-type domain-containing protein n=1 Tax=Mycena chlorophos TaxID=658473 RepID=A0A8H6TBQ5_MYCCL|nr:RING-type domain-containing protein [Mycena chlorophos]
MDLDAPHRYDDDEDDDMPQLESVSNSSDSGLSSESEDEANDVAQVIQEDDGDTNWLDVDEETDMPPLEPTLGSRRPRTDDDQDEGRDRRPPAQRVNSPAPNTNTNTTNNANPPRPAPPPNPPNPTATNNNNANANNTPLGQFFAMLQNLAANPGAMFGAPPPPPKDSPEKAMRIINGLEVVPEGLIRRLERVSALSTPVVDDVGAVGGDSGCAICWDRLLDGDGAEFTSAQTEDTTNSSDPSNTPETTTKPPEGIIALPCAHLYHASCLVPWFSRAGQTTCPTCRFDLDPKGVIWYGGHKHEPHEHHHPLFNFPGAGDGPFGGAFDMDAIPEEDFFDDIDQMEDPLWDFGVMPEEEEDDDDMPPLEALPGRPGAATAAASTAPAAAPPSTVVDEDDDMPPLEPTVRSTPSNAAPTPVVAPAPTPAAAAAPAPTPPAPPRPHATNHQHIPIAFGVDVVFGVTNPTATAPAPANPNPDPPIPPRANASPANAAPRQPAQTEQPARPPRNNNNNNNPQNPFVQLRDAFRGVFGLNGGNNNNGGTPSLAQLFRNLAPNTNAGAAPATNNNTRNTSRNNRNQPPNGPAPAAQPQQPPPAAAPAPPPAPAAPQTPPMFRFGAPTGGVPQNAQPPNAPFTFAAGNNTAGAAAFPLPAEQATAFLRALGLGAQGNAAGGAGGLNMNDFHVHVGTGVPPWMGNNNAGFAGGFTIPINFAAPPPPAPDAGPDDDNGDEDEEEPELELVSSRATWRDWLRCWDRSCGVGPSDDDPFIEVPESAQKRVPIMGAYGKPVCEHTFHPTCLVSAQRSRRGWLEPQIVDGKNDPIEVSCSVCRADGTVPQSEWLEGLAT